jgi:hypothetical protein
MNSPAVPNVMFLSDDHKHQTIEKIDAIQNLLYLIRMDAGDAPKVTAHANQADRLLLAMQMQLMPDR